MRFRRNKYNNKRVVIDGLKFDSAGEAQRWSELQLLEKAKEISSLQRQVRMSLFAKNGTRLGVLVADYTYHNRSGRFVIEDYKGVETDVFRLKLKLLKDNYPEAEIILSGRGKERRVA